MEIVLFMVIMFGGLFLMSQFSKKQAQKRADAREERLGQEMVPGAWVQTYSGFFGRFVDKDGKVVILETPSGEETYWLEAAVSKVGEPPFEVIEETEEIEGAPEGEEEEYDFDFDAASAELAETEAVEIEEVDAEGSETTVVSAEDVVVDGAVEDVEVEEATEQGENFAPSEDTSKEDK